MLIGMMGCGKSSVGRKAGEILAVPFVDTDEIIEGRLQMSIPHIFEKYGEAYFRVMESDAARQAASLPGAVISTGGGMVLRPSNMAILKAAGVVIYLRCGAEQLYERTKDDSIRPLLGVPDRLARIKELLAEREPLYNKYSDLTVDIECATIEELSEMICDEYRRNQRAKH